MMMFGRRAALAQHDQSMRPRSTLKSLALLAAMLGAGLAGPVSAQTETEAEAPKEISPADVFAPLLVGQMRAFRFHDAAQELPPITFFGAAGELRDLSEFEGKVALVNFWALWCAPCLRELPALDELAAFAKEELGEDVVVIAINLDRGDVAKPLAFLEENGLEHLVFLHEPTFVAPQTLKLRGMPTTLLLDRKGRQIGVFEGEADWASAEAKLLLERAAKLP